MFHTIGGKRNFRHYLDLASTDCLVIMKTPTRAERAKALLHSYLVQGHLASTTLIGIEITILFKVPSHFVAEDSSPLTSNDQSSN